MAEPFDEYVDQFTANAGPYGIVLNFSRTAPKPIAPGSSPQVEEVGSVRMSMELYKVMVYILKKQVQEIESQLGVSVPVSFMVLNSLKIGPEDWEQFWRPQPKT